MKKRRLLSVFLALVILLLNIPTSAVTVETEKAETDNNLEDFVNTVSDDEIFILEEDTSKRGQFEKHFLCSDGSYIAVTYNNTGKKYITDSKSFQLSNISAKIKYGNYTEDDSISLEYTVYQDKIEEDIIIGKKGTADSFTMNMNIGNLMPKVNPDGSVFLTDESGEVISRIGIPYTVDSAFAVCNDISVKAEKSGTNCKITYIPNKEWMISPDRVYPVTLDPSISTNDYVSSIEDTYVEENSSVNHSYEQYLYINRNGNRKRNIVP